MPSHYIPIGGTRAWNDRGAPSFRWWQSESEFCRMMASLDCHMVDPNQPFVWTTDLNGIHFWKRWKIWGKKEGTFTDHRDWVAGGENLIRYCDSVRGPIPYEQRNFITHSHGFQVWAYAAALGLRCRTVIAIGPPRRHDMEDVIRMARKNVSRFVLIIDKDGDRMASLGGFGGGSLLYSRTFDFDGGRPDQTIRIPEIDHSRILGDRIDLWKAMGLTEHFL